MGSKNITEDEFAALSSISYTTYLYPGNCKIVQKIKRTANGGMVRRDTQIPKDPWDDLFIEYPEYEDIELSKLLLKEVLIVHRIILIM